VTAMNALAGMGKTTTLALLAINSFADLVIR
jgi:flagellar biosynthesis GTPase FlhF